MPRIGYRVWQFWRVLSGRPDPAELEAARSCISPGLFWLFLQMSLAEQAHALRVFKAVGSSGKENPALLEAALLHDIGKALYPMSPWERAVVVLVNTLSPKKIGEWGQGEPKGWRRAFVIAAQHAEWGAEMAAEAGAGDLTVQLIREHQTASSGGFSAEEAGLLEVLKKADNNS